MMLAVTLRSDEAALRPLSARLNGMELSLRLRFYLEDIGKRDVAERLGGEHGSAAAADDDAVDARADEHFALHGLAALGELAVILYSPAGARLPSSVLPSQWKSTRP